MLKPASRFEENAEAISSLVRPLAIFFVIALALAATVSRPVEAASRERSLRRTSSAPAHVLTHSYPVRRRRAGSTAAGAANIRGTHRGTRHEPADAQVSARPHRRSAVMERATRRGTRSVVVRDVAMSRTEPMAHPVAGVNSMVEAAPRNVAAADAHPSTISEVASAGPANEMAEAAIQPHVTPEYTRTGRLIVPPPLRGSREILVHQNQMADAAGLERIQSDEDLDRLRLQHQLVEVGGRGLALNPELPENRRFARPWTAKFAGDIARAYYTRFGQPLELSSAVRTISYQLRLQRVNGNAAAIEGETASPHLTGQAIDFGKKGMTTAQIAWMRMYLTPLMNAGMIDVEEEFQQACFHISVYRSYTGGAAADLAQARKASDGTTE